MYIYKLSGKISKGHVCVRARVCMCVHVHFFVCVWFFLTNSRIFYLTDVH